MGSVAAMSHALPVIAETDAEAAAGAVYSFFTELTDREAIATLAAAVIPPLLRIALIIVVAYLLNRVVRRMIKRFVRNLATEGGGISRMQALRQRAPLKDTTPMDIGRATMRAETIAGVLRSLATAAVWGIAIIMILGEFAINLGPLIAGAGIVGVALGFGAQKLVQDFLSGIFMLMEDQYGLGDIVDTGEATGVIEGITLRTTRLRAIDGTVWHVPNGQISRIGNLSQEWARVLLDVGVAYDTDLPTAIDVIQATADDLAQDLDWAELIFEAPESWGVHALADSEITLRLAIKVAPGTQWKIERELRKRIKAAFDVSGIVIPFPQRTVWTRADGNGQAYLRQVEHDDSLHGKRRHESSPDDQGAAAGLPDNESQ